jgi:hypothetical protein
MVSSSATKDLSISKLVLFAELLGSLLESLFAWPNKQNEGSSKAPRFDCEILCIQTSRLDSGFDNYRTQKRDKTGHWWSPFRDRGARAQKPVLNRRFNELVALNFAVSIKVNRRAIGTLKRQEHDRIAFPLEP